jgi:N-acetylglucosaminyldiphosphoundecaprenol N-acetyl-beta-D-mannosaminyltransferase
MISKQHILGVGITNETGENILEYVLKMLQKGERITIVTPNPEILVYANKHKEYQKILNEAQVSLADGVGLLWAGRMLGKPLKRRVTGVDFVENLCKATRENPVSMGFLGGGPGIAERAADCLVRKYPWVKVAFAAEEWPDVGLGKGDVSRMKYLVSSKKEELQTTNYKLQTTATIDILFVAFGFPKQERWIAENLQKLPVKAAMGVGGTFDYLSGEVMRAPVFIRSLGLEWLFRLVRQPWRWKRQLALLEFVWLVLKEALKPR